MKDIIEVKIGFNILTEEIEYIKSDFLDKNSTYKEPIEYTARLIEMGLEHWIRTKIGVKCPGCGIEFKKEWSFCPNCGWSLSDE